ncbi:MAG: GGDEF domain-containing protein [Elusimicrobia bacterium]|nr:GGDEF domain-containing protein [Elusimicrobiota bacterium]
MSSYKRRRSDRDEHLPLWKTIPHHVLFPAVGVFCGACAPVGAFAMRYWLADPILKALWVRHEIQYNLLFYAYMGIGAIVTFVAFGFLLGRRSERQRLSNKTLQARVEELHLKSVTDSLTGAYTHAYLRESLEIEIQHALTSKRPLSVLMLDVDDFKRINDTHGHLFGDRVIKEAAETVRDNIRSEDILGRYGGDEFLVIMPDADHDTAVQAAKRVLSGFAGRGKLATVSIGAATLLVQGKEGPEDLLKRADANLYEAKRDGKNRVSALVFPTKASPKPPEAAP